MTIKWNIQTFDTLDSTQTYLKQTLSDQSDLTEGLVISASSQTSGQGRHGRIWESPKDNLYVSFLLKPSCDVSLTGQIALLAGLSILEAVHGCIDANPLLKWPNDILIDTKKCCGILLETIEIKDSNVENLIIGFGLNIHDAPLENATSIASHTCNVITSKNLLANILEQFSDNYTLWQQEGFEQLRQRWLENTYPRGTKVSVKVNKDFVTGDFEDIDILGNLIILCDETKKQRKITSGDVFLL